MQNEGNILLDGKPFNPREHSIGYLPEERDYILSKRY